MSTSFQQLTVTFAGGQTVGACALTPEIVEKLSSFGEDVSALNRMTWRCGAGSFSEITILMLRADVVTMLAAGMGQPVTIKFGNTSDALRCITADKMYSLEPRPIHVMQLNSSINAMYACRFVDERYFWAGANSNHAFNMTVTIDRTTYYTQSENTGVPYTWEQIADAVIDDLPVSAVDFFYAAGFFDGVSTPNDYLMNYEPSGVMLDRILDVFGATVYALPNAAVTGINPSGARYLIGRIDAYNTNALLTNDQFLGERIAGGVIYSRGNAEGNAIINAIMPSSVTVKFPRQIPVGTQDTAGSANPPPMRQFKVLSSTAGRPSGLTGRTDYSITVSDALWAVGPIGTETNLTALRARADALSANYYRQWQATAVSTRHSGVVNPLPVAGVVEWHHTAGGVFTDVHVMRGLIPEAMASEDYSPDRAVGLGGAQVFKTFDGSLFVNGVPVNGPIWAKITAVSGTIPGAGAYTAQTYDGLITFAVVRNLMEADWVGSPGSQGVSIGSNGTVNGTACAVKYLGVNAGVMLLPDPTVAGGWAFSSINWAE